MAQRLENPNSVVTVLKEAAVPALPPPKIVVTEHGCDGSSEDSDSDNNTSTVLHGEGPHDPCEGEEPGAARDGAEMPETPSPRRRTIKWSEPLAAVRLLPDQHQDTDQPAATNQFNQTMTFWVNQATTRALEEAEVAEETAALSTATSEFSNEHDNNTKQVTTTTTTTTSTAGEWHSAAREMHSLTTYETTTVARQDEFFREVAEAETAELQAELAREEHKQQDAERRALEARQDQQRRLDEQRRAELEKAATEARAAQAEHDRARAMLEARERLQRLEAEREAEEAALRRDEQARQDEQARLLLQRASEAQAQRAAEERQEAELRAQHEREEAEAACARAEEERLAEELRAAEVRADQEREALEAERRRRDLDRRETEHLIAASRLAADEERRRQEAFSSARASSARASRSVTPVSDVAATAGATTTTTTTKTAWTTNEHYTAPPAQPLHFDEHPTSLGSTLPPPAQEEPEPLYTASDSALDLLAKCRAILQKKDREVDSHLTNLSSQVSSFDRTTATYLQEHRRAGWAAGVGSASSPALGPLPAAAPAMPAEEPEPAPARRQYTPRPRANTAPSESTSDLIQRIRSFTSEMRGGAASPGPAPAPSLARPASPYAAFAPPAYGEIPAADTAGLRRPSTPVAELSELVTIRKYHDERGQLVSETKISVPPGMPSETILSLAQQFGSEAAPSEAPPSTVGGHEQLRAWRPPPPSASGLSVPRARAATPEVPDVSCTACSDSALGQTVIRAMGDIYHMECFKCALCAVSLDGKPFFPQEGDTLFCEACDLKSRHKSCGQCGEDIQGVRTIKAGHFRYHPACFACRVSGRSFLTNPGEVPIASGPFLYSQEHVRRHGPLIKPRALLRKGRSHRGPGAPPSSVGGNFSDVASVASLGSTVVRPGSRSPAPGRRLVHRQRRVIRRPVMVSDGATTHMLAPAPQQYGAPTTRPRSGSLDERALYASPNKSHRVIKCEGERSHYERIVRPMPSMDGPIAPPATPPRGGRSRRTPAPLPDRGTAPEANGARHLRKKPARSWGRHLRFPSLRRS